MVSLSWDQPWLSIYPHGFSGSKRRCGSKPSFHGVESHRAGALLQAGGSSRPWTCPDLMPQLLVPRRMSIPDFRLLEEMLLTFSTVVLQRILPVDVQRVSAWGCGTVNRLGLVTTAHFRQQESRGLASSTFCPSLLLLYSSQNGVEVSITVWWGERGMAKRPRSGTRISNVVHGWFPPISRETSDFRCFGSATRKELGV